VAFHDELIKMWKEADMKQLVTVCILLTYEENHANNSKSLASGLRFKPMTSRYKAGRTVRFTCIMEQQEICMFQMQELV
jgi:hypothetical protein